MQSIRTISFKWVFRDAFEQHLADFNDNGVIDFPIAAIFDWPAKGNGFARGNEGVPLMVHGDAAPFVDVDSNGIYNPAVGDYPKIKGDQMLWYVYNDKGGIHTETGGRAIGVEIQISAYGYNCPADDILFNTLLIDYKIIYRGTSPLYDVYIGKWIDFDLGCYANDYVGCDSPSNTFYAYNGTAIDFDCTSSGYGNNPPIQTVTFLNQELTGFTYYNNDFTVVGNPENAVQYYNYLSGFWKDNSAFTSDSCNGYGGTVPTRFFYPGNPSDSTEWSECSCNHYPSDRRGMGTIGPFTLNTNQVIEMTLAFTTHFLPFNECPDFTLYRQRIDSLQFKFDNNLLQPCMQTNLTCADTFLTCVWPGDANADGIADVWDVLPIGIGFDTTGPVRPNATTTWTGQPMQDWAQNFTNVGQNYKHADCDGSGLIDSFDFQPILDNYGLIHFKKEELGKTGIPLYLDFPPGFHPAGSTVSVPVILGTSSVQVANFYGIAFRVAYNTSVVQPGSVTVDFNNTWIGTSGLDLAGIHKELSATGRIDIGITRIDHATRAGYGRIATINYILIDDIAGKDGRSQTLDLNIVDGYAISNDESEIELEIINGMEEPEDKYGIRIYPNPADRQLVIEFASPTNCVIQLFDIAGKILNERNSSDRNQITIETATIGNGIYFLRITSGAGTKTRKIIINR